MSYDTNIYVGWYAQFDEYSEKREVGTEKLRQCPNSKKHFAKDKFCPSCGVEIITIEKPVYKNFVNALLLSYSADDSSTTQEDIDKETFGQVKLEDLKEAMKDSYMIFPEFLGTDKVIIMAPSYTCISDVRRSDGSVNEVTNMEPPSKEWEELIKKAFKAQNLEIKYGVVVEVM